MTLTIANRELRLEVAYNVRHIGGYRTRDGRITSETIVRSAGLHRLTENGLRSLADTGITTVVDLRSSMERERDVTPDPSSVGIRHVLAPVFEQDLSPVGQSEDEFPGYAVAYERMLESGKDAYRTLFEIVSDGDGGILFHCAAGKDRTGVAAALMLGLAGVDDETIVEDYAISATLLEPLIGEWLPRMAERGISEQRGRQLMASPPEDMRATLLHIDRLYGSPAGYLESIGMSPTAISAARARLVD
jgi:protein-tyrosine phosphatase